MFVMTHKSLSQWDALTDPSAADQLDDGSVGVAGEEHAFLIHDNTVYHHGNCTNHIIYHISYKISNVNIYIRARGPHDGLRPWAAAERAEPLNTSASELTSAP